MRKLPALALTGALMLSLAACGSDDDSAKSSSQPTEPSQSQQAEPQSEAPGAKTSGDQAAFKGLKVKQKGGKNTAPDVDFSSPVDEDAKTGATLVNQGKGEQLKKEKLVSIRIAQFDAKTGKQLTPGSYKQSQTIPMTMESFGTVMEDAYTVLKVSKVGADVGFYVPAEVAGGQAQTWIMHVDAQENPPEKADKATVKKLKAAGSLPSVSFKGKTPSIKIPKGKDAPKDLIVDVIKEGDGKAATSDSKVKAKYQGVRWEDGKVFDGSYDKDKKAIDFGLSDVIPGWTEGLTGVKAGSTVLLSIPTSLAYGENPPNGPAGPLVFVVELDKVD